MNGGSITAVYDHMRGGVPVAHGRVQFRRTALFGVALSIILLLLWGAENRRRDPLIEGKRLSEWSRSLIDDWPMKHSPYSYPREYRKLFASHQHLAVPHLISATRPPGLIELWRQQASRRLPSALSQRLKPRPRRNAIRWVGVLALSDLARNEADPRIARFFLRCMRDPHRDVRKIAAYEAGPWLEPGRHAAALAILRLALSDSYPPVRRDACRRLRESATAKHPDYASAMLPLIEPLESLLLQEPDPVVREKAEQALQSLQQAAVRLAGPLQAPRTFVRHTNASYH